MRNLAIGHKIYILPWYSTLHYSYMPEKIFKGQYAGERVLYTGHEHTVSFFLHYIFAFLTILFFSVVGAYIVLGMSDSSILAGMILIVPPVFYGVHIVHLHHQTYLTITSRRIIKSVRHGFFMTHHRELRFEDVAQIRADRAGSVGYILGYGHVDITSNSFGGSSVYFRGIHRPESIVRYLSRVIDYIRHNGPTDDITPYRTDREREQLKHDIKGE